MTGRLNYVITTRDTFVKSDMMLMARIGQFKCLESKGSLSSILVDADEIADAFDAFDAHPPRKRSERICMEYHPN